MVFNTILIASTVSISADIWQSIACSTERISGEELLDLVGLLTVKGMWPGRTVYDGWNRESIKDGPSWSTQYTVMEDGWFYGG
nr:hypothetical protein [Tanacetum cinerariifolium]